MPSPSVHSLPEAQGALGFICHRVGCDCLSGIDDTFKMKNVTTLRLVWGGDRHAGTRTCAQLGPHGWVQRLELPKERQVSTKPVSRTVTQSGNRLHFLCFKNKFIFP